MVDDRDDRADNLLWPKAVTVTNEGGISPYLFVCEHASHFIPDRFDKLGLNEHELTAHIAWDPGAVEVARQMGDSLNACVIEAELSRLLIDCNRSLEAPDLIPETSEATLIPGNQALSSSERAERIELSHAPFHACVEQIITKRSAQGQPSWIVTIHSFTPAYLGTQRPWEIGIIHDEDDRIARPLIEALKQDKSINVGVNQPYSPADRVYYTLERHARPRNAPCVMVELRNDEIASAAQQKDWADRLATIFQKLEPSIASQDAESSSHDPTGQKG